MCACTTRIHLKDDPTSQLMYLIASKLKCYETSPWTRDKRTLSTNAAFHPSGCLKNFQLFIPTICAQPLRQGFIQDGNTCQIIYSKWIRKSSQVQNIVKLSAVGMTRTWVKCRAYVLKKIHEHCHQVKNIQGYINNVFKFENIQEHWGGGSVRTLFTTNMWNLL